MKKAELILIGAAALTAAAAALLIQHHAEVQRRDNEAVIQRRELQLTGLTAEHQELSNRVAEANHSTADNQKAELARLRSEVAVLEKQARDLENQPGANRRAPSASALKPTAGLTGGVVFSETHSIEYDEQLYDLARHHAESTSMSDARNLSSAVRQYARAHDGEFPRTFEEAASFAYTGDIPPGDTRKGSAAMAGVNNFELVYQGSVNELTDVPHQAVALIRQKEPWPTPAGKWARIYIMAAGEVNVVESSDHFQSWEAEHIIPPPDSRP